MFGNVSQANAIKSHKKVQMQIINERRRLIQHKFIQEKQLNKKCIIIPHNGLGDQINTISMCKYLSTIYDTVYHACNPNLYTNIKLFYNDNDKVILYKLITNYNENFFTDQIFNKVKHIYILGIHKNNPFLKNLKNKI